MVSPKPAHASGGIEMMKAAVEGAKEGTEKYGVNKPKITAVTVLTSIDQRTMNEELKVDGVVGDQVLNLAQLARIDGLDGIVCSAAERRGLISSGVVSQPRPGRLP